MNQRRARRGPEQYFDKLLVDLVDGLFNSAAQVKVKGRPLFPTDGKPAPGAVRSIFEILPIQMTAWRFMDWQKLGIHQPLQFTDKLISVFEGTAACLPDDRETADLVHAHWTKHCRDELEQALAGLRKHREELESQGAKQPFASGRMPAISDAAPAPSQALPELMPGALAYLDIVDLSPPPCPDDVARPDHVERVKELAKTYFGVIIEGLPKSGKRHIALQFVKPYAKGRRLLWYNLGPATELKDVLKRLGSIDLPVASWPEQGISGLAQWLFSTDTVLVLDGLERMNASSFAPLLQLSARLPGPSRIVVTSSIRTEQPNVHEIGWLSVREAFAILEAIGIPFDPDEIRAVAEEGRLSPYTLRQAAARFGTVGRDNLSAEINVLHREIVADLAEDEAMVLEVLQVLNTEFDQDLIQEVLDALAVDRPPLQIVAELESLLLIAPVSGRTWRLQVSNPKSASLHLSMERMSAVLLRLAWYYRAKVSDVRRSRLSRGDCFNLFAACRLLQLARAEQRERDWLRGMIATSMERFGAFKQLALLYETELEQGASPDEWLPFRFARVLFVLGRYEASLAVLDQAFHQLSGRDEDRDEEMYLCIVRLISEILIEINHPATAAMILDSAIDAAQPAKLGGLICIQAVSVLSWALVKAGLAQECIELNDEILDKQFEGLAPPFSRNVSNIRVGVALRALGRIDESIDKLEAATRFFASADARAYAWGMTQLAWSYDQAGQAEQACRVLAAALEANASHNFFSGELGATYDHFTDRPGYERLAVPLQAERERIRHFEQERLALRERVIAERLVEHVLLDLSVDPSKPLAFDKRRYQLFSLYSPHAIGSRFNRSLLSRLREANLETTLENLFASKLPTEIFSKHIYNRVLVTACKDSPILAKKFLYPHLEVVIHQADSILLFFARFFESAGDIASAELMLKHVKRTECFSYYNVRANCAAHSRPLQALEFNELALSLCRVSQQRAQVLNNMATIVYDAHLKHRFRDAVQWCEQSIGFATKRPFHWPRNLLLKLSLAICELEEVPDVVTAHAARFRVSPHNLERVISDLRTGRRKEAAFAAIHQRPIDGSPAGGRRH